jgi:hypothetical protein
VISLLAKRLETPFLPFFTLPLVYDPEITTCHYEGLLQEYAMLCYGFPNKGPSCTMWAWVKYHANPHSFKQDTQHIVFLISKQDVPYRTRDDTYCPGVSTPNIWSVADSSNHIL